LEIGKDLSKEKEEYTEKGNDRPLSGDLDCRGKIFTNLCISLCLSYFSQLLNFLPKMSLQFLHKIFFYTHSGNKK
jgi:hypothetical protein